MIRTLSGALLLLLAGQDPAAELDRLVPPILEKDRIPGAVVVAGTKDGVTLRRAYGTAKLDTVFDLASLTKVVGTTTAAMRLVEEGKLSLDDLVGKHLAAFKAREITIRELLHHRSGLPAYLKEPREKSPDGILGEISGMKMEKKYRYS